MRWFPRLLTHSIALTVLFTYCAAEAFDVAKFGRVDGDSTTAAETLLALPPTEVIPLALSRLGEKHKDKIAAGWQLFLLNYLSTHPLTAEQQAQLEALPLVESIGVYARDELRQALADMPLSAQQSLCRLQIQQHFPEDGHRASYEGSQSLCLEILAPRFSQPELFDSLLARLQNAEDPLGTEFLGVFTRNGRMLQLLLDLPEGVPIDTLSAPQQQRLLTLLLDHFWEGKREGSQLTDFVENTTEDEFRQLFLGMSQTRYAEQLKKAQVVSNDQSDDQSHTASSKAETNTEENTETDAETDSDTSDINLLSATERVRQKQLTLLMKIDYLPAAQNFWQEAWGDGSAGDSLLASTALLRTGFGDAGDDFTNNLHQAALDKIRDEKNLPFANWYMGLTTLEGGSEWVHGPKVVQLVQSLQTHWPQDEKSQALLKYIYWQGAYMVNEANAEELPTLLALLDLAAPIKNPPVYWLEQYVDPEIEAGTTADAEPDKLTTLHNAYYSTRDSFQETLRVYQAGILRQLSAWHQDGDKPTQPFINLTPALYATFMDNNLLQHWQLDAESGSALLLDTDGQLVYFDGWTVDSTPGNHPFDVFRLKQGSSGSDYDVIGQVSRYLRKLFEHYAGETRNETRIKPLQIATQEDGQPYQRLLFTVFEEDKRPEHANYTEWVQRGRSVFLSIDLNTGTDADDQNLANYQLLFADTAAATAFMSRLPAIQPKDTQAVEPFYQSTALGQDGLLLRQYSKLADRSDAGITLSAYPAKTAEKLLHYTPAACTKTPDKAMLEQQTQAFAEEEWRLQQAGYYPVAWRYDSHCHYKTPWDDEPDMTRKILKELSLSQEDDALQALEENRRQTLSYQPSNDPAASGSSKVGGQPDLPAGFEWPAKAQFVAQFNLAEFSHIDENLPKTGLLTVFATDLENAAAYSAWFIPTTTALMTTPPPAKAPQALPEHTFVLATDTQQQYDWDYGYYAEKRPVIERWQAKAEYPDYYRQPVIGGYYLDTDNMVTADFTINLQVKQQLLQLVFSQSDLYALTDQDAESLASRPLTPLTVAGHRLPVTDGEQNEENAGE